MYKTWAMQKDELWSDQFWGLAGSLVRATELKRMCNLLYLNL